MAKKKKPRKCRICKKSPVWRGGDVKNPGPYCKKCYHKHIWVNRPGARDEVVDTVDYAEFFETSLTYPFLDFHPYWYSEDYSYAAPDDDDWEWWCQLTEDD